MLKMSKIRILTISIIAVLLTLIGTVCFAADEVEIKLNRKVYFEGDTYTFHNARKVRKDYEDGELGCGVISIILKNKIKDGKPGVYITGEGWVYQEQIKSSEKYISLDFKRENGTLASEFKINGEHLKVESANTGIANYEDGVLTAGANGTTIITITDKNGEEIEVLATVHNGGIELNIPEKSLSVAGELNAQIAEGKVNIDVDGGATGALTIGDGAIGVGTEATGNVNVNAGDNEIVNIGATGGADIAVDREGVQVNVEATQTMSLLQRLALMFNERATASVSKENASVSVGGDVSVNDNEIASGEAGLDYNYGEEDPSGNINVEIMDNEVVNKEGRIPIISTIKALLAKLRK